jgi:pilus assembly protein Flp/PilA
MSLIAKFAEDESGATAVEYALLASLIFIAIVASTMDLFAYLGIIFLNIGAYMETMPSP